ncbi:MAG: hypothetical protein WCZ18_10860 [Ottowia sp.]|nr:hypothetical protein [Ottowia sp.]
MTAKNYARKKTVRVVELGGFVAAGARTGRAGQAGSGRRPQKNRVKPLIFCRDARKIKSSLTF